MSDKLLTGILVLTLLGCGKPSASPAPSSLTTSGTPINSGATVEPNNPYILSVDTHTGGKQFFALPDELSAYLYNAVHFESSGPEGEKAHFGVYGYPVFSEKLRDAISAFESSNPGIKVKRVNPLGTRSQTVKQTWLKTPGEIATIFLRPPTFGPEVRTNFVVPSNISFVTWYLLTDSGAHFLQMLENQPKNLTEYFKFRYCYFAEETGVDGVTVWKGNVCVTTRTEE